MAHLERWAKTLFVLLRDWLLRTMKEKAFVLSALFALVSSSAWAVGVFLIATERGDEAASVVLVSYGLVALLPFLISLAIFKERRWQAAVGSLGASLCCISALIAVVAWFGLR